MSEVQSFYFSGQKVQTVEIDNQTWWVAKDIAEILEYADTQTLTRRLEDYEKGMQNLHTLGGNQSITIINESGLYTAILGSNKPQAKVFKKWVTSVVLPSIRKTGSYSLTETGDRDIIKNRYISLLEKHNDLLIDLALYKDQARNAKKIRPMTEFEIAQIRGMTADGFGCAAIARELDRAESTIRRHRQEVSHE